MVVSSDPTFKKFFKADFKIKQTVVILNAKQVFFIALLYP